MPDIIYKPVDSIYEYEDAYRVAIEVFSPSSVLSSYEDHKRASWINDPYFNYQNIFIAKMGNKIIGVIRIVPREISIQATKLRLAGISSVCLLPEFQGKGLSVSLMGKALSYATYLGYEVSALFARRSADYYYNRFGFFGLASYSKFFLKNAETDSKFIDLALDDFSFDDIDLYAEAYLYSYKECSGYIYRTSEYWRFLLTGLRLKNDSVFKAIKRGLNNVGYVIYKNNHIYELAIQKGEDGLAIVDFLNTRLRNNHEVQLIVNALPQHRIVPFLKEKDVTYQTRECYYGGHMVRILNIKSVSEKINCNSKFSNFKNSLLTYAETCEMLKVWTPSSHKEGYLPFDICEMDHF